MRRIFLILAFLLFVLSHAAIAATSETTDTVPTDLVAADSLSDYEACDAAKRAISRQLRDSDSARFECLPAVRSQRGDTQAVRVNAKNAYGAYTGWEVWAVVFMPDGTYTVFTPDDVRAAGLR